MAGGTEIHPWKHRDEHTERVRVGRAVSLQVEGAAGCAAGFLPQEL